MASQEKMRYLLFYRKRDTTPVRVEYQWNDLHISFGQTTVLTTSKGTTTIGWYIGDFLPEVSMFEFQNEHYFLLKTAICGNTYCNGEYRMYRLDQEDNLISIPTDKNRDFWSTGGWGGYPSGKLWGIIAIQDKLYLVFMKGDSAGAATVILNHGSFERVADAPNIPLYGKERIYINAIAPSWNLQ